ncbi:MAG: hypothetical protein Kow0042_06460 [Calditrichia bacterium]
MTSIVYLLEANPAKVKEIQESAPARLHRLQVITDFDELEEIIEKSPPDAVFLDYEQLQAHLEKFRAWPGIISFVFGDEIDFETRSLLYEKGVSRILDGEFASGNILFHILNTQLFRKKELKPLIRKYVSYGQMDDLRFREILLNGVLEKRNLILKIQDMDWPAKIRTYQGEIVEAVCPGKVGVDAALSILQYQRGQFRMRSYMKNKEISTIAASTVALILEAGYEAKILQEFLQKFSFDNPIFQKSERAGTLNLTLEQTQLLEWIDTVHEFQHILWKSPFGVLKTLRLLDELYQIGALTVDLDLSKLKHFTLTDVEFIRQKLFKANMNEGRLIVLGFPGSGKSQFIKTLAGVHRAGMKTSQSLDFTQIQLADDLRLNVFGIAIDSYFQPIMQKLSDSMLACFFLIDFNQTEGTEYNKYLIQQFIANYDVPMVFGITNAGADTTKAVDEVRTRFDIPLDYNIVPVDVDDFHQIRQLFFKLSGGSSTLTNLKDRTK